MDPYSLGIPIAFILLGSVLCLLLIDSRWGWKSKLALIIIVPAFGLAVWKAMPSYKGWPTSADLPKRAMVFATLVHAPDPAQGDEGVIYLWAMPYETSETPRGKNPLAYAGPGGEPRAYKLPYSAPLHRALDDAQDSLAHGTPMVLELGGAPRSGAGDADGDPPAAPGGESQGTASEEARSGFRLYELPMARPPEKHQE